MAGSEDRAPRRQVRSGAVTVSHPDLEWRETVQGSKPGDRFVRVATHKGFTRVGRGHLVPRKGTGEPTSLLGRALQRLSRVLIGRPLATSEEPHDRLNVFTGLAVFASDNISSSAYATEEIMRVLVLAGAGVLALTMPITLVIVLVLAIVVISYQQTIRAYPSAAGRLRPHRLRVDCCRCSGADLGLPRPVRLPRPGWCRVRSVADAGQFARHPRERHDFHRPDVRVPGGHLWPARVRPVPFCDGHLAGVSTAARLGAGRARNRGAWRVLDPAGILRGLGCTNW